MLIYLLEQEELLKETDRNIEQREAKYIAGNSLERLLSISSSALHVDLTSSDLYRSRIRPETINDFPRVA